MANKKRKTENAFSRFFHSTPMRVLGKGISVLLKCIVTILLVGIITATVVGSVMVVYVLSNFNGTEGLPDLDEISVNETSVIKNLNENNEWVEYQQLEGNNSVWVDFEEIPQDLCDAVVAIEDKRFYEQIGRAHV